MNKENLQRSHSRINLKKKPSHCKNRINSEEGQRASQGQNPKVLFNKYMRYLIATNAGYFKNKLCSDSKSKHKNMQFKIPSSTGKTTYTKDFIEKSRNNVRQETLRHILSTDNIQMNNYLKPDSTNLKLDGRTTYQNQYKFQVSAKDGVKESKKKEVKVRIEDDEPRFFDTQNKVDFLNWGGKNYVPSMKPSYKAAVTNCSFQASSVYNNDFKKKVVVNSPSLAREQSFPKFGNWTTVMKTSYSNDFSNKALDNTDINCKPKQFPTSYFKQLRGSTEYKRQYIKNNRDQKGQRQDRQLNLQELQQLIIDL